MGQANRDLRWAPPTLVWAWISNLGLFNIWATLGLSSKKPEARPEPIMHVFK